MGVIGLWTLQYPASDAHRDVLLCSCAQGGEREKEYNAKNPTFHFSYVRQISFLTGRVRCCAVFYRSGGALLSAQLTSFDTHTTHHFCIYTVSVGPQCRETPKEVFDQVGEGVRLPTIKRWVTG